MAAREVTWRDGAAAFAETVWIERRGAARRRSRGATWSASKGSLQVPEEPGFRDALEGKGSGHGPARRRDRAARSVAERVRPARRSGRGDVVGGAIERVLPPREAGLLLGLALGDDSQLDPATERDFQATGLTHLLVVSGGNVAMFARAGRCCSRKVLGLARVGAGDRSASSTVAFIVILTGAEPSVLRAGTMAVVAFVGVLLAKPRATAVVLAAAVLALLVLDPALGHLGGVPALDRGHRRARRPRVAARRALLATWLPRPLALADRAPPSPPSSG